MSSSSHLDEARALALGRYINQLSNRASKVELLLVRLSRSTSRDDPRLAPLIGIARELVEELREAATRAALPDRELAVKQLLPTQAYRLLVEEFEQFKTLPDELDAALSGSRPADRTVYEELARSVDTLNTSLQRRADQAIAG